MKAFLGRSRLLVLSVGGMLALLPWAPGPAFRTGRVQPSGFRHDEGFAYRLDLTGIEQVGPSDQESPASLLLDNASSLVVLEDERPLAGPHQAHTAIRSQGKGCYSHWGQYLYLSASDNSDPRTNGRVYSLVQPRSLLQAVCGWGRLTAVLNWGSLLLGVALLVWGASPLRSLPPAACRAWLRAHTAPQAGLIVVLGLIVGLLYWNHINVATAAGRLAYAGLLLILVSALGTVLFLAFVTFRLRRELAACPWLARKGPGLIHFALALTVTLLGVECAARVFPVFDSLAINPGTHFFWPEFFEPRNSLGYNDREPGPKRGPRVLVLGDSYTEGAGVRRHERYTNLLEGLLRQRDPSVEVFAGARCGFDTCDEADLLERTGDAIQPDVVVVGYVLNDAERPSVNAPTGPGAGPSFLEDLLGRRFPCYAYYQVDVWKRLGTFSRYAGLLRGQHDPSGPGWALVTRSLDRIAAWCDARHVRRVLIVFPLFMEGGEDGVDMMEQVVQAGQARGFEAYHIGPQTFGRLAEIALSAADAHPGPKAHRIIAASLAQRLGTCTLTYQRPRSAGEPRR
jgi:hypothetical protein